MRNKVIMEDQMHFIWIEINNATWNSRCYFIYYPLKLFYNLFWIPSLEIWTRLIILKIRLTKIRLGILSSVVDKWFQLVYWLSNTKVGGDWPLLFFFFFSQSWHERVKLLAWYKPIRFLIPVSMHNSSRSFLKDLKFLTNSTLHSELKTTLTTAPISNIFQDKSLQSSYSMLF